MFVSTERKIFYVQFSMLNWLKSRYRFPLVILLGLLLVPSVVVLLVVLAVLADLCISVLAAVAVCRNRSFRCLLAVGTAWA